MWFHFGNRPEAAGGGEAENGLHREATQRIFNRPAVEELEQGIFSCANCGMKMALATVPALSIGRCPQCGSLSFFPMRVGDYWLYEPLGGGGMGSVYHACHVQHSDLEVAVKLLPRERKHDQGLIQSLLNEAEVGYRIGAHPHLMQVCEYGQKDDEYYAVFEYIEGIRLDQLIESPVRRSPKQVMLWALQLLSAEQHMYDRGYLFRDLKPQNVIIDQQGNIKLLDYGLTMSLDEALNHPSEQIKGSPFYLPPERIVGSGESMCSEIYSLGMVLFHVLARRPYYSAEDVKHLVSKHVMSLRITDVSTKLPGGTDPEVVRVLNRMIQRNPNHRYQSFKEVGAELFSIYKKSA